MPMYNPCPPSEEPFCYNGGDCFYIPEDPTIYICSCFMPYYGPRCEHEASKNGIVPVNYDTQDSRRPTDRALIITALVFVVITFLVSMTLVVYWSFKRKCKMSIPWTNRKIPCFKSPTDKKDMSDCGVQANFGDGNVRKKFAPTSNQSASVQVGWDDLGSLSNMTSGITRTDTSDWKEEELFPKMKEPDLVQRPQFPKPAEGRNRINSIISLHLDSVSIGRPLNQSSTMEHQRDPDSCTEHTDSDTAKVLECLQLYGDDKVSANTKKPTKSGRAEEKLIRLPPKTPISRLSVQNESNRNMNNVCDDFPESSQADLSSSTYSVEVPAYLDDTFDYRSWFPPQPPCTFIVASEHDALLSDLFSRGHRSTNEQI